jgi:hypothetical protein
MIIFYALKESMALKSLRIYGLIVQSSSIASEPSTLTRSLICVRKRYVENARTKSFVVNELEVRTEGNEFLADFKRNKTFVYRARFVRM